mmetsp:Transcript_38221/g.92488  ORF Transcript_38221/g.92488 Transcript_38221/m.92488 type:complete len:931 (-) Transcript_38221:16-2808(-)
MTSQNIGDDGDVQMTTKKALELRPETKQFLDICNQYMKCRELMDAKYQQVDECQRIANLEGIASNQIRDDSAGDNNNNQYKSEFQQQALDGTPAKSLADLYEAAEQVVPAFEAILTRIIKQVESSSKLQNEEILEGQQGSSENIKVTIAPLKGRNRAQEKAEDDYIDRIPGSEATWLYDIVRASIEINSAEQLISCIEEIQKDTSITIVKAKNRFQNPTLTGYRDINICIQVDSGKGFYHICEVQIHHRAIKTLSKELKSHTYYEYFRRYFAGATDALGGRLNDLKLISEGAALDESFLTKMLEETSEEDRLLRLADLFDKQLCEHDWALRVLGRLLDIRIQQYGSDHYIIADSYNRLGDVLQKKGNLDEAMEAYEKALSVFTGILKEGHSDFSGIIAEVNSVLRPLAKLQEALQARCTSLKSHRDTFTEGTSSIKMRFKSRSRMSQTEDTMMKTMDQFQRKFSSTFQPSSADPLDGVLNHITDVDILKNPSTVDDAMESCQSSLAAFRKADEQGLSSADASENVSMAIDTLGELENVLDTVHRTLKRTTRMLVEMQTKLAIIYNNQATVLQLQGDLDGAMDKFQTSLTIKKKTLGEDNAQVAERYVYLGNILELLGRPKVALGRYERALHIFKETLGEEHSFFADTLVRLANVLNGQGQRNEAEEHYFKAIGIYRRTLGEEHLSIANAYMKVGDMHRVQRKHDGALEMYQLALGIQRIALGEEDVTVGETYELISILLRKQGKDNEADEAYGKSLDIKKKNLGQENMTLIEDELKRAKGLAGEGKPDEAMASYQKALDASQKAFGSADASIASIYNEMALLLSQQGTLGRAMMLHYKALGLLKKIHGEEHESIAETYMMMGATLLKQNRLEKALKIYGDAVDIYEKKYGNEHSKVTATYQQIADTLESNGNHVEATEYRTKASANSGLT